MSRGPVHNKVVCSLSPYWEVHKESQHRIFKKCCPRNSTWHRRFARSTSLFLVSCQMKAWVSTCWEGAFWCCCQKNFRSRILWLKIFSPILCFNLSSLKTFAIATPKGEYLKKKTMKKQKSISLIKLSFDSLGLSILCLHFNFKCWAYESLGRPWKHAIKNLGWVLESNYMNQGSFLVMSSYGTQGELLK